MDFIEFFNLFICLPDRGKTCSLCCHNIHTDTEISAQSCNTRSYEFHNFILYIAVGEYFADDCKCNVLRSYSRTRFPFQIDCHNARHIDVICLGKELFYKFSATFTEKDGCRYDLGCKGPGAYCDSFERKWNGVNWCVANAICIGCTEPTFPDGQSPFYSN